MGFEKFRRLVSCTPWRGRRSAAVIAGFAIFIGAGAIAQQPQAAVAAPNRVAQEDLASTLDEVVVSGTRIVRDGYDQPTPVTVLSEQIINDAAAVNIADTVNKLPSFSGSLTPHSTAQVVSDANGGVNNLNLRSLGANRTLVLLDGVRVVGSSITGFSHEGGAVDINEFPDQLVSRVDVVTGGASAVYGSDAMAGVVNFILDKNFTGVKAVAEGGVTSYSDDEQYLVAITGGTPFADNRGHLLVSLKDTTVSGVSHLDRPWAQQGWEVINNPAYTATNGQPSLITLPHVGLSVGTPGGLILSSPLAGIAFGRNGTPYNFNFGPINNGFQMQGGDWQQSDVATVASLDGRSERQNAFARASYDISDAFQVYFQTTYAQTHASGTCCPPFDLGNITITQDNPFIPATVLAQMKAQNVQSFTLGTTEGDMGYLTTSNVRTFTQYVVGAGGEFTAFSTPWKWDSYFEISSSKTLAEAGNNEIQDRLQLAVDAVVAPNGAIVCRSTLTNPGNGCVPWNPMGLGVNTQAALNYVTGTAWLDQIITEHVGSGTVRGEPFNTWAGPVSIAAGVEYRTESVHGSNDPLSNINDWFSGNYHATSGSYDVTEGYFETVIPLAKDQAWAKSLDLNGAVRETDYSTSGLVTTWKAGIGYRPISDIRFRATISEDIRAPNLGDLFAAGQSASSSFVDPFRGGAVGFANSPTLGNVHLKPESARTDGAGIVLQPSWAPGFSASIDYYNIEISGAITSLTGQQEIDECYAGNTTVCPLIQRNAQGIITLINIEPVNVASQSSRGFDVQMNYDLPLDKMVATWKGNLSFLAMATHVISLVTDQPNGQIVQGAGVNNQGGTFSSLMAPKWRWTATVAYDIDPVRVAFTGRGLSAGVQDSTYIQCTSHCPAATVNTPTIDDNHIAGAFYADLSLVYKFARKDSETFLTVENLFNRDPPLVAGLGGIGFAEGPYDAMTYDGLGRIFRAGVRFRF